jgi:hypothetical protein
VAGKRNRIGIIFNEEQCPMMSHDDGPGREGIENALRMLADPAAEFLPGAEQIKRLLADVIRLLDADAAIQDPELLATLSASEYKERLTRAQGLAALLGNALYKNQGFLRAVRQDKEFHLMFQYIASDVLHNQAPSRGIPQKEILSIITPFARCTLLIKDGL